MSLARPSYFVHLQLPLRRGWSSPFLTVAVLQNGIHWLQLSLQHRNSHKLIPNFWILSWASICKWLLDLLTGRPHSVSIGQSNLSTCTLNTNAPEDCVLKATLCSLCTSANKYSLIFKSAGDTVNNSNEPKYRKEIKNLVPWFQDTNLAPNMSKMK